MLSAAPAFWWREPGWQSACLSPLAALYGAIAGRRMSRPPPFAAPVPVLCIGNFTLGGAGKTPTALALAKAAKAMGLKVGFLSRGYGGRLEDSLVDPACHTALEVGDEPLLLARTALTAVSRRRAAGARLLAENGVDVILMDDGFQSARILIDHALIVADGRRGVGNARVFPAGPLRAPLGVQKAAASALLTVGEGAGGDRLAAEIGAAGKPVYRAWLQPAPAPHLHERRVLAFAGIADPGKFERTLRDLGAIVALRRDFADHAALSEAEIAGLLEEADRQGLHLVTTAKDTVRLAGRKGRAAELAARAEVVEVEMAFSDPLAPRSIVAAAMEAGRRRLGGA